MAKPTNNSDTTNVSRSKSTRQTNTRSTRSKRDQSNSNRVRKTRVKSTQKDSLSLEISREKTIRLSLQTIWDLKVRPKSDAKIIAQLVRNKDNFYSHLSGLELKRMRTLATLGTKVKTAKTLISDDEKFEEFLQTQVEPVLSDRYVVLLKQRFKQVFKDLDLKKLRMEVDSNYREFYVTGGSSYPEVPAPSITTKDNKNVLLLNMIVFGDKIFSPNWAPNPLSPYGAIADGKISFVPKNYKGSRVITRAPRELTDKQLVVSNKLRDYVTIRSRKTQHIIQFDDQTVQHALLKKGYATIDSSSASDRVYTKLLKLVWPEFVETFDDILPKTVLGPDGKVHNLVCVGTQGFPLTFTLMAIVMGLIVEAVSWKRFPFPSANYGDDIVVHELNFNEVYSALGALGLVVNQSKTHLSSTGFIESCGKDVFFSKKGITYDITPIHIRGWYDIEVIEFCRQMLASGIIEFKAVIKLLRKLDCVFYAYPYPFPQTDFHLNYGDEEMRDMNGEYPFISNKIDSRPYWDSGLHQFYRKLPAMSDEVSGIKGLDKKQSGILTELLNVTAQSKDYLLRESYVRQGVLAEHRYLDLIHHKFYDLNQHLMSTDMSLFDYSSLEKKYGITVNTIAFFVFITSEYRHYRTSYYVEKFSFEKKEKPTLSKSIDFALGIKILKKESIYRYKRVLDIKRVPVPGDQKKIANANSRID